MLEAAITRRVGRKMEFPDRITLPLAHGVLARIDASLEDGEPRLDLIREAIEKELLARATAKARQRQVEARLKANPPPPPPPAK